MQVKEIKQFIMSVLIKNREKRVISPDLVIDRLFDNLNLYTLQEIEGFARSATGSSDDVKDIVWDRYLVPVLMMGEMKIDRELTCTLKNDKVDLTDLSDVLKSAVKCAVLRRQGFLDDDNMVTFVNLLTNVEQKRKVVDF